MFIDLVAAETYLLIQSEQNDTEIKRLENLVAENQKAINNLMVSFSQIFIFLRPMHL